MGMCGGAYGGSCTPTVSVTNAPGTVSGTVTLMASASARGTYTVASVQFRVDGVAVGMADSDAPYSDAWNSTSVANGAHMITAVVTDSANQTVTSLPVNLTVSNGARRHGLGRELLRRFLRSARELGAEQCFLEVRQSNVAALGLYCAEGFAAVARRVGYYPPALPGDSREDALVLRRALTGAQSD